MSVYKIEQGTMIKLGFFSVYERYQLGKQDKAFCDYKLKFKTALLINDIKIRIHVLI